jgi:hypothetical protein
LPKDKNYLQNVAAGHDFEDKNKTLKLSHCHLAFSENSCKLLNLNTAE